MWIQAGIALSLVESAVAIAGTGWLVSNFQLEKIYSLIINSKADNCERAVAGTRLGSAQLAQASADCVCPQA